MPGVLERLDQLSKEVEELKRAVFPEKSPKRRVSLKGALRGAEIRLRDIEGAKRSLAARPRLK